MFLLGAGMADMETVQKAYSLVTKHNDRVALLQCTSTYPAGQYPPHRSVPPVPPPTLQVSTHPTLQVSTHPALQVSTHPTPQVSTHPALQVSTHPTLQVSTHPTPQVSNSTHPAGQYPPHPSGQCTR